MAVLLHTGSEIIVSCVANFLNTSSTEKCTMGIRTVVQMQAILSSRRSWALGIFWGRWTFQFCFLSLVGWYERSLFKRKSVYVPFLSERTRCWSNSPWINLYLLLWFLLTIKQVPTHCPWDDLFDSVYHLNWEGFIYFQYLALNWLFCIRLIHSVAYKVFL